MPAGPAWVNALRAAWDAGDAVAPLDLRLAPAARARLLDALAPSVVIGSEGPTSRADGVPVADGDALVVATSGTTGDPKGVVLTHDAVRASAVATSERLGVDPSAHRWLACLPLAHIGGLSVVTKALATGAGLTVLPGFEVNSVIAESGPDVLVSLVATALARVETSRFRTVVLGGSAPAADLPANVVTTYGMTETGSGVVYDGRPLDGVSVDVRDGEIWLKCPMLLRAYRQGDQEKVPLSDEGWFATGDCGSLEADGRLRVEGRLSDMIVTGGENVWPAPVEAILRRHPAVGDVAVGGRPDPEWGQRVVAWVVPAGAGADGGAGAGALAPDRLLPELRSMVRDELAGFAAPKEVVLVDSLPRTALGKVQRSLLT